MTFNSKLVSDSYLFFQEWYDREERKMHLSRDTSSMAENETKDIPNKITDFKDCIDPSIHCASIFLSSGPAAKKNKNDKTIKNDQDQKVLKKNNE